MSVPLEHRHAISRGDGVPRSRGGGAPASTPGMARSMSSEVTLSRRPSEVISEMSVALDARRCRLLLWCGTLPLAEGWCGGRPGDGGKSRRYPPPPPPCEGPPLSAGPGPGDVECSDWSVGVARPLLALDSRRSPLDPRPMGASTLWALSSL